MLHVLVALLSVFTDYQAMSDLAHGTFAMGVANVSLLWVLGAFFAFRRWRFARG